MLNIEKDFFETKEKIKVLQKWLSVNDSIILQVIKREDFEHKKGNYLNITGDDSYVLYLPEDLQTIELIDIILYLEKKLGLEQYKGSNILIEKTKISLGVALKKGEITEEEIQGFIEKYNISQETQDRFKNHKLTINKQTKKRVKGFGRLDVKSRDLNLEYDIKQRFHAIFFSRGKQILYDYLNVFTKNDYNSFWDELERNPEKKLKKEKNDDGNVSFDADYDNLPEVDNLLKDVLDIEELKKRMRIAEQTNDEWNKNAIMLGIVNDVIREIYKYPRQEIEGGEYPSNILQKKEMHCVGKTILGHIFLEELGIKHYAFVQSNHIALIVDIMGKEYYFDAVAHNSVVNIRNTQKESCGKSDKIFIEDSKRVGIKIDPERALQSTIWTNLGKNLSLEGKGAEGFYCVDYAIELLYENSCAWDSMGTFLKENHVPNKEEALNCFEISLDINSENASAWEERASLIKDKLQKVLSLLISYFIEKDTKNIDRYLIHLKTLQFFYKSLGETQKVQLIEDLRKILKEKDYIEAKKIINQERIRFNQESQSELKN